jgi:hypothetical protein
MFGAGRPPAPAGPPEFEILEEQEANSRSRNTRALTFTTRFNESGIRSADPRRYLESAMEFLFQRLFETGSAVPSAVGVQVQPPNFTDGPFTIPLRPPLQNSPATVAEALLMVNEQYNGGLDLFNGTTVIKIFCVWPLEVTGGCSILPNDSHSNHQTTTSPQSLVRVLNAEDRFCLARAVLIGIEYRKVQIGGCSMDDFTGYCRSQQEHGRPARELLVSAGCDPHKSYYDLQDIDLIQRYMIHCYGDEGVRLVVFSQEHQNHIVYKGPRRAKFDLTLFIEQKHYSFIGKPHQLMKVIKNNNNNFYHSTLLNKFFYKEWQ